MTKCIFRILCFTKTIGVITPIVLVKLQSAPERNPSFIDYQCYSTDSERKDSVV